MEPAKDMLGNPVTELEAEVARIYGDLKALAAREDLPPCVERNAKKALACFWQLMNDCNLECDQLYDLGV